MDSTTVAQLARLRRLAHSMTGNATAVDQALPEARKLLDESGEPYRIVGGLAVVHHGYARMTEDIDVLVTDAGRLALLRLAGAHGFTVESRNRLRHTASGVRVDLLVAGEPIPRRTEAYPSPLAVASSERDPGVVALAGLLDLKLLAHRHQDLADVVALLKRVDDARYVDLESKVAPVRRGELADLRRDALEELAFETSAPT